MVSNVAEAESMSKSEQGGWEQIFFDDYAALFVFLLTYFFLALCNKICRIKYNKEFRHGGFEGFSSE